MNSFRRVINGVDERTKDRKTGENIEQSLMSTRGVASIFQRGFTLCYTQGTYQIVMSTSALCFVKVTYFGRAVSMGVGTSLQNSCIDDSSST